MCFFCELDILEINFFSLKVKIKDSNEIIFSKCSKHCFPFQLFYKAALYPYDPRPEMTPDAIGLIYDL